MGGSPGDTPLRIVVITPFETPEWRWVADRLDPDRFSWTFLNGNLYGRRDWFWNLYALRHRRALRDHDLVISFHPWVSIGVAFWKRVLGIDTPHFAFGFNHGNKRFFKGPFLAAARWALPRTDLFSINSEGERRLYGARYRLPRERMFFSHWAVNPPDVGDDLPEPIRALQPYVCCIGRNNRDLPAFIEATRGLDVNTVIVCGKRGAEGLHLHERVVAKTDIPRLECQQLIAGAALNVVPLADNNTGAGHMTIVDAMLLGKAQVVTRVDNVSDYFFGGAHGLWAEPGSAESLRAAIARLLEDDALRKRCEANALEFAGKWLTEEAAARNARLVLEAWAAGDDLPTEPPGWAGEKARLQALNEA